MAHVRKLDTAKTRNGRTIAHYEVRWTETEIRPDGSRRKKYKQETYPTRAAADARVVEIENERATVGAITGREARLEPFGAFAVAWLASLDVRVARGKLKARTRAEYDRILNAYLLPEFGTVPIGSVSPERVERFAAALLGPPPPGSARRKALSPATFKRIWHVFGRVCTYAVRKGAIPTSPLERTELDGGYATGDEDGFAPHPLTADQVGAVAGHIEERGPVYGLVILFLAYTGVRAAELAGLEVGDLTLDPEARRGTVRISRTKRRRGGEWIVGTPKSRKSRRTIPLDGWLVELLVVYLADTHPRADDPTAPLFPNRRKGGDTRRDSDGRTPPRPLDWDAPVEPGALYSGLFQPALAAVGLPVSTPAKDGEPAVRGVRLHDLRHTFAVLSLSAGEHYMMVSKWLGHATFSITLDVYGDYIPEDEGGKAAPLARPSAPSPTNVIPLRRSAG